MEKETILKDAPLDDALNYYGHKFYCDNCNAMNHRYIRKGVRIKGLTTECDVCGCTVKG